MVTREEEINVHTYVFCFLHKFEDEIDSYIISISYLINMYEM